jgi:protein SCO1/2
MDIRDSFKDAARKKEEIMKEYGRKGAETGWHFLVGDQANILKLTGEVGFKFKYDEANKEFAHGSGIFILTPKGKISRFFPGIQYPARNVKFSLMEAASNKIGTVVERLILYCYRYDDHAKGYVVYVQNLMRVAGLLTGVGLFGYLGLFWWGERKRQHEKGNMSICS